MRDPSFSETQRNQYLQGTQHGAWQAEVHGCSLLSLVERGWASTALPVLSSVIKTQLQLRKLDAAQPCTLTD